MAKARSSGLSIRWPAVDCSGVVVWRSSEGVTAVTDVYDGDGVVGVVDEVADAVLASAGTPVALEWLAQRCSDSMRVCGEGPVEEFHAGAGGRFGEPFGQLARRSPCHLDSILHRSACVGLVSVGQQRADLGFVENVPAGDVSFGVLEPLLRV